MTSSFNLRETPLSDLVVLERKPRQDSRGWFERVYCQTELQDLGLAKPVLQINRSMTKTSGTVRGMHFQHPPDTEIKLVSCLEGRVFDVAIDLRPDSPTFLQYHGVELSPENNRTIVIPEGFAHGFQTLTDNCELLYCHTANYNSNAEGGVNPADPRIAINWPQKITHLSDRDQALPFLTKTFSGIRS